MTSTAHIRVKIADTDAGGVVYHGRYFDFFEAGRNEFMDRLGLPYKALMEQGYHLPVIEAQVKYIAPAMFDDRLEVQVTAKVEGSRLVAHQKVLCKGKLLTEATTVHVFINKEFRPVRPTKEFLDLLAKTK